MKQLIRIMMDHFQADAAVTYFLISAVGENIQYQHKSSSGISVFVQGIDHTSYQSNGILNSPFQILSRSISTFFHCSSLAKGTTRYSGQSKVIRLKYIPWLTSQNFQSSKQFNTSLYKRYGHFCTSSSKNLNTSHKGVLAREGLSFELSRVILYVDHIS